MKVEKVHNLYGGLESCKFEDLDLQDLKAIRTALTIAIIKYEELGYNEMPKFHQLYEDFHRLRNKIDGRD
ncbi:hypothetical protein [Ectobacillus sp. sgz5001026]|uniref:hypothetical protein n=1 Tax=Ectobacillus sp. sgz5001026 TaxID=3242473 RepID=UPI0036D37D82